MATPKLRFKEFNNQWDKTTINDQAQTVTSGSRDWAQYYSESGDKFIRMTNLVRDGIYLDLSDLKFVQLPKDSNEGKRTSLKFGDILISITAELGKLGWIPQGLGTAYINQHTALVRMKDSVDSKFVAYSLSTEKYNNKLNSLNDSGAKAGLNLGTIRNFELIVPPKEEQTKIASLLSIVDEKISQLTQKNFLLSQYKQGMMQKLFSQQIRFKAVDGSEFGEWEEKNLVDISNIITGTTPETANKSFYNGSYLFVSPVDIQENRYISQTKTTLTESGFRKCRAIPKNSILFVCIGSTIGKVAQNKKICATNQQINAVIPNDEYCADYVYFQLLLQAQSIKLKAGTQAVPIINKTEFGKTTLLMPCLEEQIKIATFLSAIDQKIEVVAQQLKQAKQWKKGLLQQMFV